jgi:hypothetical protein
MRRRVGVRRGPGLLGMAARTAVVAGTATAVSGRVGRHQQEKYAQQQAEQEQAYAQQAAPQQAAPQEAAPPGGDDLMASLQKLADLHAAGVLTDAEFAAAKAKLLG